MLPFANVGGDPETEYLSDGVTESVIASLSRIPKLKVIAFTSVLRYKGKPVDVQEVVRELPVAAILTGRILQRGTTCRSPRSSWTPATGAACGASSTTRG